MKVGDQELNRKVLTIKEVSHYLGVHPSTIYRLMAKGRLPGWKMGSDWRFNLEEIDAWRMNASKKQ